MIPPLPESVKRAEVERLAAQLARRQDEWGRLQRELRQLEFRVSVAQDRVTPASRLRLRHWRALDCEYRKTINDLSQYLHALEKGERRLR